jgi:hypothetical protein
VTASNAARAADARGIRARARRLEGVADAAAHAAARLEARGLIATRDERAADIASELRILAVAHRTASRSLGAYADALDVAAHRRRAIDDLTRASHDARGDDAPSRAATAHLEQLRAAFLAELDGELAQAAQRCADDLASATPPPDSAARVSFAVARAVEHARVRLLWIATVASSPMDAHTRPAP